MIVGCVSIYCNAIEIRNYCEVDCFSRQSADETRPMAIPTRDMSHVLLFSFADELRRLILI